VKTVRKAALLLSCGVLLTGGLRADKLWDNGVGINSGANSTLCDSGPGSCGNIGFSNGTMSAVVFDNFSVPTGKTWVVSGFTLTDFFVRSTDVNVTYKGTSWSIWNGSPLSGGTLVASGTAIGSLNSFVGGGICSSVTTCGQTLSVSLGTNVVLSSGTYYLGTTNQSDGSSIFRALGSAGGADFGGATTSGDTNGWFVSRGDVTTSGFHGPWGGVVESPALTTTDSSFDIQGTVTPEPGTWALMVLAVAGFGVMRRRKAA
jgi:hypothetical protein